MGGVQTVLLAGAGITGGTVIGFVRQTGSVSNFGPVQAGNLAATIYQALGLPPTAAWHDELDRPHMIYNGTPILGLL